MTTTTGRHAARRRGLPGLPLSRRGIRSLAIPLGLVLSGALVWQSSYAAFTATTSNAGNAWQAGTVTIEDNDAGAALFSTTNASGQDLEPGEPSARCIKVTYTGNSDVSVKMYATAVSGDLAPYLKLKVEESTVGELADCSDFATGVTPVVLYNDDTTSKTLSAFGTAHSSFGTGVSSWAPTGTGQFRTYRITTTVVGDNAAQGTSAQATFNWEAQTPLS
jgi:hypothetical protein